MGAGLGGLLGLLCSSPDAIAQSLIGVATPPLELDLLQPDADLSGRAVVTRDTVEESELTLPSLWWADQQHGGKLLENWIAYTGEDGDSPRVDLVVDRQLWRLYSYVERYQFVHRLGIASLQFGYSTRVFNDQGALIGAYLCSAPQAAEGAAPPALSQLELSQFDCQVYIDSPGIETPQLFGL